MNIISLKKTFGFNSDESSKNNVFWHKTFGTPLRSSKRSFKTSTGVSHRLYTRICNSFLGNFCFFFRGLEWLKINYVTLSVVNKRRIYNIYIAQVITTLQQGESFFICLEKILSFLFYLTVSVSVFLWFILLPPPCPKSMCKLNDNHIRDWKQTMDLCVSGCFLVLEQLWIFTSTLSW